MAMTREQMLRGMYAREAALDGRYLTGVVTTGIYCLPSCPARKPNAENVRFFETPDEARAAGLRPCRRCRPDDFHRDHDPELEVLRTVVAEVRDDPRRFDDVGALCARAGFGRTKLNALFREHHHTTPAAFLNDARIAAARRLLADTDRKSIDVAYAVGYESLSAFHDNFRRSTALAPEAYRALGRGDGFTLALPPGYRTADPLRMLGRDPESAAERVDGSRTAKAIRVDGSAAVLRMEFGARQVRCSVASPQTLSPDAVREAHRIALRILGLGIDPAAFERRIAERQELRRLTAGRAGLRIPLTADVFEALTWAVIGQQINLGFASSLRRTLIELCGEPAGDGLRAPPPPAAVARLDYEDLTRRRFSRRKAEYLIDAARLASSGALSLDRFGDASARTVERRLLEVRGIGAWTAQYVMLRGCGLEDCVPVGDSGLLEALRRFFELPERPDRRRTLELMEPFAPYRSLATAHFWRFLGGSE